ncbi:MAG: tetratricopeptide repeat protein [Verrucomicrobiota bacterium]|nr:MAG: sel1 repeat family protein [Verrucomicrobiota bacterium]
MLEATNATTGNIPIPFIMKTHPIPAFLLTLVLACSATHRMRAEEKSIDQLTAAADKGDADAQFRLGQAYIRGIGVKKNLTTALEFIQRAANQGHPEAIGGVGYFHANGFGVKQDLTVAADWFRKGAEKGGAKAQLNYAQALLNGRGVPVDEAEGMKWIDKAIAQDLDQAYFAKGEFHYHGTHGIKQDFAKAREFIQKAADSDHAAAQNMLGAIYQEGLGVTRDLEKAEFWFRKSAEQGDPKGMSNLGQILGPDGPDASKHVEALKWLLLARRANESQAKNVLNLILRTRPPAVVAEAQKQMVEFKPRPSLGDQRKPGLPPEK